MTVAKSQRTMLINMNSMVNKQELSSNGGRQSSKNNTPHDVPRTRDFANL